MIITTVSITRPSHVLNDHNQEGARAVATPFGPVAQQPGGVVEISGDSQNNFLFPSTFGGSTLVGESSFYSKAI